MVHLLVCERLAGGVPLHKSNAFAYTTISVQIELRAQHQAKLTAMSHLWIIIVTQINMTDESKLIHSGHD